MLREILAILMVVSLAGAQTTPLIDMADVVPRNRINEPTTVSASVGRTGGNIDTSHEKGALEIEIVSATVANDTKAPTLIFQVRLHNAGKETLAIPIDPNLGDFEPTNMRVPYSYTCAHIAVVLQEAKGVLLGVSLYGSKQIAGSLMDLRAGESVEIRARTSLKPVNPNTISVPRSRASVKAALAMQQGVVSIDGDVLQEEIKQIAPEIVSTNAITLMLGL